MRVDRQDGLRRKLGAGRVAFSLAFHLGAIGGVRTIGLLLAALVASLVVDRSLRDAHVAVGLGLTACLVVIARAHGLTAADLGLSRSTWPAGLRWGAGAGALGGGGDGTSALV